MLVSPLVGIAIVHRLPRLPVDWEWAAGGWTCLLCLAVALRCRQWWLWALAALVLGVLWCAFRAQLRMNDLLQPALEGVTVPVRGVVDGLPQRVQGMGGTEGWRFEFRVIQESASTPAPPRVPPRVLLSCYNMPSPPQVGEQWSLSIKWRRPRGLMNPHGGDSALWMLSQNIPAVGSCASKGQRRESAGRTTLAVDAWRQRFRDALFRHVAGSRGAGVLAALSLGDQGAVSSADWALYRDTGVAHLLSVSGLHVTMFAWLAGGVSGWCWRRSARLCLRWPAPRAALWIGTAAAWAYALFSGWGVPAQRTFGLLLILAFLQQCRVAWPWSMSLAVAALGVTLADPWALTQPGYWLSFGAVALLMSSGGLTSFQAGATGMGATLLAQARSQWVVTVGLAPLTLLLFQQLSVVGWVANAVAIPVVSYLITRWRCWASAGHRCGRGGARASAH